MVKEAETSKVEINKTDIIERLACKVLHLDKDLVALSVNTILNQMVDNVASGKGVEIRGFGSIRAQTLSDRMARNPKTGEKLLVQGRKSIRFKPGLLLRKNIDQNK